MGGGGGEAVTLIKEVDGGVGWHGWVGYGGLSMAG